MTSGRQGITLARQNTCANPGCSRRSTLVTCACGLFASQICRLHDPLNSVSCEASRRAGRRQPIRFRRNGSAEQCLNRHVGHVLSFAARLRKRDTAELDVDEAYLRQAFKLPFAAAYWHVYRHQLARTGQFGPLDLRSPPCQVLLARYVCDSKNVCWESIRQRWAFAIPGSEAIVAVWALRRHASCCSRSRGLKVCDRWLRVHGLPGTKRGRVQWPKLVPRRVFNGCLRAVKTQLLQSCHPVVAKWLAESLQPVLPPQSNYTRRWNHIRACRYWCQGHWFDMSPAELQLTSQDGAMMQLRKLYWKTPIWEPIETAAKRAESRLRSWIRSLPATVHAGWERSIHGWLRAQYGCGGYSGVDRRHEAYVAQLTVPHGYVAAQEDKDKSSCWVMPLDVYSKLLALMVNQDAQHWARSTLGASAFVAHYRQQHLNKLPSYMQTYCSVQRWKSWNLPYMYINIKSKCFSSGNGRTCHKPGHACCRRVVSWASHPCRWLYKLNARALEAAVRLWGAGFETRDLFSAVADFRLAVSQLRHDHGCLSSCHRCRKPKPALCLWVGDAAQLFEEISQLDILSRLKHILRELEQNSGGHGVVTKKNRKLHFWLARNNFRPSHGAHLHRWNDIVCISELALMQTAVTVGPTVYEQRRGVPIGGFMSKQFASVFLGYAEANWIQQMPVEEPSQWKPSGFSFRASVAATRYVDDLALASSLLCTSCLGDLTRELYEAPICFEETLTTEAGLPWLDVWMRAEGLNLEIHSHGVEQKWRSSAALGDLQLPVKFRMMPFQGPEVMDSPLLAALLCGRLKRLKSLQLSTSNMKRAVECELQIWALHGYPLEVVQQIWSKGRHYPEAVAYARETLKHAIQRCGPHAYIAMPWEQCSH